MRVVVLTGAGVSAESGVPTFRDAAGLWEGHDPMTVATPEAFDDDPTLVHRFYDERRAALGRVQPNTAHKALARLGAELGDNLYLVTQNVDDLHEHAGSQRVHPMHGRLRAARCTACDARHHWETTLIDRPPCPGVRLSPAAPGRYVVRRGALRHGGDRGGAVGLRSLRVDRHLGRGPPGGGVRALRRRQRKTDSGAQPGRERHHDFHQSRRGPATELVPAWVDEVLGRP